MKQLQRLTRDMMQHRKEALEQVVKRRFIYQPGFALYGGVAGLYDLGPVGCALKNNIEQYWREHFVIEEDMLEVSCTCITPEVVLKASGHVDKFADLLVLDIVTKQGFRADKLVNEFLEAKLKAGKISPQEENEIKVTLNALDGFKEAQMSAVICRYGIKSPETGNELSYPEQFNLMLPTSVGPSTKIPSFLRPETAQGIFLNFPRLLEQNGYRLPFGGAQIGLGFRNEIAPRNQLIRCREFQMAEIEYFIDPLDKACPKFNKYRKFQLPLLSRQTQSELKDHCMTEVGAAVDQGIIDNETLAYFICRTYEFLVEIGVDRENIRFRQHQADEMAHYSQDCWDAEIQLSQGWVECVGIADRSAFDLNAHSKATNTRLVAARKFKVPQPREVTNIMLDKAKIGKELKKDGTLLIKHIDGLPDQDRLDLMSYFEKNDSKTFTLEGKEITLNKALVKFEKKIMNVMEEKFVPSVIEPSFGIGRILQSVIEHSFKQRDAQRQFFKFSPRIAPYKCSIFPIVNNEQFTQLTDEITALLKKLGISCKTDNTGVSLGKKYARADEIGIPFALTVDKDTLLDRSVTLREIESTKQIRISIIEVPMVVLQLSSSMILWEDMVNKYPTFEVSNLEESPNNIEESKE